MGFLRRACASALAQLRVYFPSRTGPELPPAFLGPWLKEPPTATRLRRILKHVFLAGAFRAFTMPPCRLPSSIIHPRSLHHHGLLACGRPGGGLARPDRGGGSAPG